MDPRRALRLAGATAALAAPTVAGVTWIAARTLTAAPPPKIRRPTLRATFLGDHTVALEGDRAADPGSWGLSIDGGFVRIDAPVGRDGATVLRPYEVLEGEVPTAARQTDRRRGHTVDRRSRGRRRSRATAGVGDRRRTPRSSGDDRRQRPDRRRRSRDRRVELRDRPWPVDATITRYAWPDDPQVLASRTNATLRIDGVRSGGHVLPTWLLVPPDADDTWVVAVHGRSSSRTELFRIAEIALRAGHPVVIASYRTDAWTAAPTTTTTLGTVEWHDIEATLAYALAGGAARVVLAGCSLGGSLVAQVVRRSRLAPWVCGVLLDSPALSWTRLLRHVASTRRLPAALVPTVMAAARLRSAVDWSALDHLAAVEEFRQPVLLLHGDEDDVVPVWLSEAFAAARPDLVTFERFPGADHVGSWNHAPRRYERAVRGFLDRIAADVAAA